MDDGRPAILLESGQAQWRWTHGFVENVAQAITLAVVDDRAAGKVYNVGETETPTVAERVRRIGKLSGWNGQVLAIRLDRLPSHLRAPYLPSQDLVMDTSKFREELGFLEVCSRDEGLERTIEWERGNPPAGGDPSVADYAVEDRALG
jgi:nucleoside-diphosphate-sugar epimerase